MAIFGQIKSDDIVQTNDKIRFDCSKSYLSGETSTITLMELDAGGGYIDITTNQYLDWEYATELAAQVINLRITTDGAPVVFTKNIQTISAANEKLFSIDNDLVAFESDILNYIPDGRSSFNNIHRRSQQLILDKLDNLGYTDKNGNRFVAADIIDIQEVKEWSVFKTLKIIYLGLSNLVDDEFDQKMKTYESLEQDRKSRTVLRIDWDKDGVLESFETLPFSSISVNRG